jgi:hypothetical protein
LKFIMYSQLSIDYYTYNVYFHVVRSKELGSVSKNASFRLFLVIYHLLLYVANQNKL